MNNLIQRLMENWEVPLVLFAFIAALNLFPRLPSFLIGLFLAAFLGILIFEHVMKKRLFNYVKSHIESLGYIVVEVKSWRNHYGVTFTADGKKYYLKFHHNKSFQNVVDWIDGTPEEVVKIG